MQNMASDQKVDPKQKIHISLCNCHEISRKKVIEIQRSKISVDKLLTIAKNEMNLINSVKIYRECGREFTKDFILNISNNDSLYISDGKILDDSYDALNLCVMGAGAVGKSAVTLRFIQGQFVANYDPTIEDAYRKQVLIDGNQILLDILDTAGQEDFECLRTQWMKNKQGFILVYSIIRRTSFNALKEFCEGINEVYEDTIVPPIILVGNKVDLDENHCAYIKPDDNIVPNDINGNNSDNSDDSDDEPKEKVQRMVSFEEAVQFANKIGAIHYVETSAKSGYNVDNMIGKMVRYLVNMKYYDQQQRNRKSTDHSKDKKWWSKCQIL